MNSDKKKQLDRITTSSDNEVSVYLEIASSKAAGKIDLDIPNSPETIIVIDYGSQYSMLITRRIRESNVYSELISWDSSFDKIKHLNIKGYILSGGPDSVAMDNSPILPEFVLESKLPILGICYGMQLLAKTFGGEVLGSTSSEYGQSLLTISNTKSILFNGLSPKFSVWMSHGDSVKTLPKDFLLDAFSESAPIAAMSSINNMYFGIQFHPEVIHTQNGKEIINNFTTKVANCSQNWNASSFVDEAINAIKAEIGNKQVICALSGGVDSAVAATLVHKAIGDNLTCIFVNNGLLRKDEAAKVIETFNNNIGIKLISIDASQEFIEKLSLVIDPEKKRMIIGEAFIRVFEKKAKELGEVDFIVQGTTYPDVIESETKGSTSVKIKTHHNVGGLPADMKFSLIEPLRNLFKDEVRKVGKELGLPDEIVYRQPFPGPGLAIRIMGDVTNEKLDILRGADWIVMDEIKKAGTYYDLWQSFAILTNDKTVGVQGDQRTYGYCIAIRCVSADDAMTADWAKLPYDLLGRISSRIVNEVNEVNRVVYDITSKPPGTIEWE
ncbi:MAG: GMP synthase (glutamine-hydrolysing) [Chloroflexi bacterium]|nr:MAG: GMP synthase (glutamine-hydrolysing) [Chloroflexota bacterium]